MEHCLLCNEPLDGTDLTCINSGCDGYGQNQEWTIETDNMPIEIFAVHTGVLIHNHYEPYRVGLWADVQFKQRIGPIISKRWENLTHEQYKRFLNFGQKLAAQKLTVR